MKVTWQQAVGVSVVAIGNIGALTELAFGAWLWLQVVAIIWLGLFMTLSLLITTSLDAEFYAVKKRGGFEPPAA